MSAQYLRIGELLIAVTRDEEWTEVELTAAEGEQSTGRDAQGNMTISLGLALEPEELEALVTLLQGRQIAGLVRYP